MTKSEKTGTNGENSRSRIIVLEDSLNLAEEIRTILGKQGYAIERHGTFNGIIDAVKEHEFAIFIADIHASNLENLKIIKLVKEITPEIEIIVMTSHASSSIAREALLLGATDLLPKPFTEEQLKKIVDRVFNVSLKKHADFAEPLPDASHEKREILKAMTRIAEDKGFQDAIMEKGIAALWQYDISLEAKIAITSGNLQWLNENIGELNQKQLSYLRKSQDIIYEKLSHQFMA
ncbi:MAG: response regulator [Desulfobacteraceae bacterium]